MSDLVHLNKDLQPKLIKNDLITQFKVLYKT